MLCERCYKSKWRLSPGGQTLDLAYCYMLRGPGLSKYLLNGGVKYFTDNTLLSENTPGFLDYTQGLGGGRDAHLPFICNLKSALNDFIASYFALGVL